MIEINTNLENNIDNLFDDFDKLNNINNTNNTNNFNILNKYNNIQQTLLNTYPNQIYTMLPYFSEHSFFSENECDHINKIGYSQKLECQKTVLNTVDLSVFNCKINSILPSQETNYIYDRIRQLINEMNNKYWFFKIYEFAEPLKFIEYNETFRGFVNLHSDLGNEGIFKFRKLTVIVQLSDENSYEGGDLILQHYEKPCKMTRKRGSVIIFPSFLLHKVEPVTKGIRNSLVIFSYGPPFC
jgi:PKHD-type hydroxylase